MRGLSLGQLSVSAIAHGAKGIETRSWPAPEPVIGERIAIHASKTLPPGGLWGLKLWMEEEENQAWLPLEYLQDGEAVPQALPRGAFVATAILAAVVPTVELEPIIDALEFNHGDYRPGRFGWVLTAVRRLKRPVPYTGSLGLYQIETGVARKLARAASLPVQPVQVETERRAVPRRF